MVTSKTATNRKLEGTQYKFPKSACKDCSLRERCTTNTTGGRTVFISDYYDEYQAAKALNVSEEGLRLFRLRYAVERKNNEMKNHNGLGHARLHTRDKRRIDVKIVCMAVNLKQIVKQNTPLVLGFVRKRLPSCRMPVIEKIG